ncbi:helix-turn-helix domain-containing protein [Herbiconiux sp. YIM B11900]|uniref:helix-turn-helix domain-containing protein n=1 Tax=Herbiconiux sp. YIM B11900 TaxID=3404131 RepID=UPI003F860AF8
MIDLDFEAIGRRIANYRKMNGLSAEQLAERAGAGLTRSIVANIETGRRTDIGVQQLLAIAWALRVSPTALLFPLDKPRERIQTSDGDGQVRYAIQWMSGWIDQGLPLMNQTPATLDSGQMMLAIRTMERHTRDLQRVKDQIREARQLDGNEREIADLLEREEAILDYMRSTQASLESHGIDWRG